jgi:hypothetical protein
MYHRFRAYSTCILRRYAKPLEYDRHLVRIQHLAVFRFMNVHVSTSTNIAIKMSFTEYDPTETPPNVSNSCNRDRSLTGGSCCKEHLEL